MQTKSKNLKTTDLHFWDFKSFKVIFLKTLPIIFASMLNSIIPFVDNVVAGNISNEATAATIYSLSIQSVVFLIVIGGYGAISVVMAQYKGSKDIQKVVDAHKLKLIWGLSISIFACIIVVSIPRTLLGVFTNNIAIINSGENFLRIYGFVFILSAIATAYSSSLSSMGYVKISLISTLISIALNTGFDYFLGIYLGMNTIGLAIATLIVRFSMIATFVIFALIVKAKEVLFSITQFFKISKIVIRKSLERWHMVLIEIVFGIGSLVSNILMARGYDNPNTPPGAVIGATSPFLNLIFSGIGGFYSANAIFVGSNLGKNKFKLAYFNAFRIYISSLVFTLLISFIISAFSSFIINIYGSLSSEVLYNVKLILLLFPSIVPAYIFGILSYRFLESGGQSKTVMIFDFTNVLFTYIITPYLVYFVWKPDSFWLAYFVVMLSWYFRAFVATYLVVQKLWLVNLTNEKAKEPSGKVLIVLTITTVGIYPLLRWAFKKDNNFNS